MNLYDIAIARKLSGGGGGSSDFSTAEVTIVIGSNATGVGSKWPQPFPTIENDSLNTFFIVENNLNKTFTVPLYKGEARAMYWGTANVQNASFTGNIALDTDDDDILVITGNGTITVTKF